MVPSTFLKGAGWTARRFSHRGTAAPIFNGPRERSGSLALLVVVLQPKVSNQTFAHDVPQRVLQFHRLDEQIVLGIQARRGLRRLEIEAQPLLDADIPQRGRALGEIEKQAEVERNRRGKDGITAKKIHLDLHGITEPPEDIDVIPAFLVIAARRVIIDPHLVKYIFV